MKLFRISGDSMSPVLRDGDIIFTVKATPRSLKPGRIFVVDHSDLGVIVKRLVSLEGERYRFRGDNPSSTPEAVIAPVAPERIRGRAICVLRRFGFKAL